MRWLLDQFTTQRILSGLLASSLLLNGSVAAVGQAGEPQQPNKTQTGSVLAVGSSVVLKSPAIPLREDGRQST
jgi:hypothetical protein